MHLLRRIQQAPRPLTLTHADEVDRAQVLRAADLIAALLLDGSAGAGQDGPMAHVLALTPRGRMLLAGAQCLDDLP